MNIFLDLDQVLGDFDGHVKTLFGSTPKELGDKRLWALVEGVPDFWLTEPLMKDAEALWQALCPYNPTILTGCPRTGHDRAVAQKTRWVHGHFGSHVPVIACFSKHRQDHMEAPGDLLVDDRIGNLRRWEDAGGIGILHENCADTVLKVDYIATVHHLSAVGRLRS